MIICIDCRMTGASGIGVYLRECLPWFLQSGNDFLLLGNTRRLQCYTSNANVKIIECDIKPFSLKELFFFPPKTARLINKADLFFSPFFNIPQGVAIPVYTTIHDIIFPDMPELTSKAGLAARMWFYRRAYKKSKKIFTVSEFSKSRIERHLGTAKQVIVTHSAIQPMFPAYRNNVQNVQKTQTIVFIGNIKKHKGLDCLLDAFCQARNEGLPHSLIIIGDRKNFRTADNAFLHKIDSLGCEAVTFTGFISDEQLMEHLAEASLLVQPSLYEGFGLPPLEAMILGTRALISDIPVFREIYNGFPVTFFHAGDSQNLKDRMIELLSNRSTQTVSLAKELAEKYTFEKTASIIMKELQ
ncbi:MAG: glycosyltransferase family 4 protein [Treponema sp.]|jgi:glycosyltransferase involved in cell wall biosynthesis|nr:glycosyltransferase family 4 protein [Treponema sp.]